MDILSQISCCLHMLAAEVWCVLIVMDQIKLHGAPNHVSFGIDGYLIVAITIRNCSIGTRLLLCR